MGAFRGFDESKQKGEGFESVFGPLKPSALPNDEEQRVKPKLFKQLWYE